MRLGVSGDNRDPMGGHSRSEVVGHGTKPDPRDAGRQKWRRDRVAG